MSSTLPFSGKKRLRFAPFICIFSASPLTLARCHHRLNLLTSLSCLRLHLIPQSLSSLLSLPLQPNSCERPTLCLYFLTSHSLLIPLIYYIEPLEAADILDSAPTISPNLLNQVPSDLHIYLPEGHILRVNFFYLKPKQHPAKFTSSFGFHHYIPLVFLLLLWSFLLSIV